MAEPLDPATLLKRIAAELTDPFDQISTFGLLAPHMATILVRRRTPWDLDGIGASLRRAFARVRTSHESDALVIRIDDGPPFLVAHAPPPRPELVARALRESMWPEAAEAVRRAKHAVVVMDAPGLPPLARHAAFEGLVRVLVRHLDATAVHWSGSQCLVPPDAYAAGPTTAIPGAIHVRMFRGVNEAGERLAILMDTLGMQAFELPDLECRFVDLEPEEVALKLHTYARYVLERGDVLLEGNTVDGVGGRWRCRRGVAYVDPPRPVVTLHPGIQHAPTLPGEASRCPHCAWRPDPTSLWECACGFCANWFETQGKCPACEAVHDDVSCKACDVSSPRSSWSAGKG